MPATLNSERRSRRRRGRIRIEGERFGRLVVIREVGVHRTAGGTVRRVFQCRCDCGQQTQVTLQGLLSGDTRSCGCLRRRNRTGPPARERWREYHAERRERQQPIIDAFQQVLRELMAARAIPRELLRLRWPGRPAAFDEIFRKRRRLPDAREAEVLALSINLRGAERERFLAVAQACRENIIASPIAAKSSAARNPS